MNVAAGHLLGIDVGTTRTAAATCRTDARHAETEIVDLGDRSSAVPSVLFVDDDGSVVVGEAAEQRATSDPGHIVREFKRRVGDPTPVLVSGRPWAPEELFALMVQWVVDRVAEREGGPATRIAVTHPAWWDTHKKDLLGAALRHHGLPVTFLAEPQAAALHYAAAERLESGSTVAVYDFGGGTFDAAVVHKEPQGFSLLGRPEGVERLGGIDLDELVFEHVREGLPEAFDGLDEADPAVLSALAAVRRECTEAKEALSADTEVSIPVLTPAGQGSVRLHRSEFEAMIAPSVEETVSALRRAIASAAMTPEQLTAVLLVGGSSRIPLVAQLVSEHLGRPVAVDADPKNAIARGAALSLSSAGILATGAHVAAPWAGTTGHPVPAAVPGALHGAPGRQHPEPPPQTGAFAAEPIAPTERISASRPPLPPPPMRPALPERPPYEQDADYNYEQDAEYNYEEDAEYTYAQPPVRRSSPAALVGTGGAMAAVAVLLAVFLWPRPAPPTTLTGLASGPTPALATTEAAPTTAPAPTTAAVVTARAPVGPRPTIRVVPPPPVITTTVAVTTTEAPPTTITTTTKPPPTTPTPPTPTTPTTSQTPPTTTEP